MLGSAKTTPKNKPDKQIVEALFITARDLARQPVFYTRFQVPDTTDGRYDLFCLTLSLVLFRTQQIDGPIAQAVFDLAFKDTERGLREAGVGDLGVPKHMKRMLEAFYGRSAGYYEALEQQDSASLSAILQRNLYNGDLNAPSGSMAEWVQIAWSFMQGIEADEFLQEPQTLLRLVPTEGNHA